ncbi:hypothetical protein [Amycolatopsis sp. La24]|uniref:hypothetical protein n=1 Tax=Amycolatopsis sp. La24 TaxID=3028304 RepID=UPI0023B05DF5|nr:hypothetical protein [Amycolatopsis sp. La24]
MSAPLPAPRQSPAEPMHGVAQVFGGQRASAERTRIRRMASLIVAADSPVGRVSEALNDLARHLPEPGAPDACPTCAGRYWPCSYFDDAACRVHAARLRVGDVVPLELHPRLWPPVPYETREWPSEPPEENDRG